MKQPCGPIRQTLLFFDSTVAKKERTNTIQISQRNSPIQHVVLDDSAGAKKEKRKKSLLNDLWSLTALEQRKKGKEKLPY